MPPDEPNAANRATEHELLVFTARNGPEALRVRAASPADAARRAAERGLTPTAVTLDDHTDTDQPGLPVARWLINRRGEAERVHADDTPARPSPPQAIPQTMADTAAKTQRERREDELRRPNNGHPIDRGDTVAAGILIPIYGLVMMCVRASQNRGKDLHSHIAATMAGVGLWLFIAFLVVAFANA
jgi:hypothetical protein